jgi:16S rRNA (uracil1498-N3)-methyltransferase
MKDFSFKAKIRLYIKSNLIIKQKLIVETKQSHYLLNVMRKKVNDIIFVFNELQGEFEAEIITINKKKITIEILDKLRPPEKVNDIWVIFAPVKKNATDLIIQKSTELGVSKIIPILTERTIARRVNLKRMEEIAIEASEQSERVTIPEISPIHTLQEIISSWSSKRKIFYGDETIRNNLNEIGNQNKLVRGSSGAILIGPEGGFSLEEINFLKTKKFVIPINFGPRVLRSDTAVICGLVCWHMINGDMKNYQVN